MKNKYRMNNLKHAEQQGHSSRNNSNDYGDRSPLNYHSGR